MKAMKNMPPKMATVKPVTMPKPKMAKAPKPKGANSDAAARAMNAKWNV